MSGPLPPRYDDLWKQKPSYPTSVFVLHQTLGAGLMPYFLFLYICPKTIQTFQKMSPMFFLLHKGKAVQDLVETDGNNFLDRNA